MTSSTTRATRSLTAAVLADAHGGVAHRAELRRAGVSNDDIRTEVRAGRWTRAGRHTIVIDGDRPRGAGVWWWAVWESGSGAVLDGVSGLQAAGMTGFEAACVEVTLPRSSRAHLLPGVRLHRRREVGPVVGAGIPRVRPEAATVHAAQWAVSDRQAALLICMPVQQRLVPPRRLVAAWCGVRRSPRRQLLDRVINDVCDGAQALGELDFLVLAGGTASPSLRVRSFASFPPAGSTWTSNGCRSGWSSRSTVVTTLWRSPTWTTASARTSWP